MSHPGKYTRQVGWCSAVLFLSLTISQGRASGPLLGRPDLAALNRRLHGHVVDHTNNHGADRRIWSRALGQRRSLYVYLPPGFDPSRCYALMIWLHGIGQDEKGFLQNLVEPVDRAIAGGQLPPVIMAGMDGTFGTRFSQLSAGSFFLNTDAGRYEDYVEQDVWDFLVCRYPIRPERAAHMIAGVSMGGAAAWNHAIKYRERYQFVVSIHPPLNTRWMDCHGNAQGDFHPCCWGWRQDYPRDREVLGWFFGIFPVTVRQVIRPLFGYGPDVIRRVSRENPIEMLDAYDVRPGDLEGLIAYGARDEFNVDAQVQSFLYRARQRGLDYQVRCDPNGRHDGVTAMRFFPAMLAWIQEHMVPYIVEGERTTVP